MKKAILKDLWLVQPYQYGTMDGCEAPSVYATENEAHEAAKDWALDVAYTAEHEHECVVFRASASYRGKRGTAVRYDVVAPDAPISAEARD